MAEAVGRVPPIRASQLWRHPRIIEAVYNDQLIALRPVSQILQIAVLPEVRSRIANGSLPRTRLPLEVHQFRWVQGTVELNDEFELKVLTKVNRPMQPGEAVTLADIDPDACTLAPVTRADRPAAYFLCISQFLNLLTLFDFEPNNPFRTEGEPATPIRFPLRDYLATAHLLQMHPPFEILNTLRTLNWPPAPAYYPTVIPHLVKPNRDGLVDAISAAYTWDYWGPRLLLWRDIDLFPSRLPYLEKVLERYFAEDFISTICVLVPQFEGIVRDFIKGTGVPPNYRFESCLKQFEELLLSREVLLFPKSMLESILCYMQQGPFLTETDNISDPTDEINRHGVAHGLFVGFESRAIALKYLAMLDGLALLLLQDRIVTGKL
jgi:hypothetical protein